MSTEEREAPCPHCAAPLSRHDEQVRRAHAAYHHVGPRDSSGEGVGHWSSSDTHRACRDFQAGMESEAEYLESVHRAEVDALLAERAELRALLERCDLSETDPEWDERRRALLAPKEPKVMSDEKTIDLARRIIAAYDQAREDVWPYSPKDIGNGPSADEAALARGVLRLGAERAELRACLQRCADAIETAPPGARRAEEALTDARALLAPKEPKSWKL